jgi:hypothetical protein
MRTFHALAEVRFLQHLLRGKVQQTGRFGLGRYAPSANDSNAVEHSVPDETAGRPGLSRMRGLAPAPAVCAAAAAADPRRAASAPAGDRAATRAASAVAAERAAVATGDAVRAVAAAAAPATAGDPACVPRGGGAAARTGAAGDRAMLCATAYTAAAATSAR